MIFNKSGRFLSNFNFLYDNNQVQVCNSYSYLGVIFTPSGSFINAINLLTDKANKVFFKIRENLFNCLCKCSLKLFSTLIKPILTYGCEIWAPLFLKNIEFGHLYF